MILQRAWPKRSSISLGSIFLALLGMMLVHPWARPAPDSPSQPPPRFAGPPRVDPAYDFNIGGVCAVGAAPVRAWDGQGWVFVSNEASNGVTVVDVATRQPVAFIPMEDAPHHIHVFPGKRWVYVTPRFSSYLFAIDTKRPFATKKVEFPGVERGGPLHLSFSPDGKYAFVSLNLAEHVAVIDVDKAELVTLVRVGRRPRDVGVTPDGRKVFVSLQAERYIAVLDVGTWKVRTLERTATEYKLPGSGSGLDVSWDGKLVAVNNTLDNEVVFFDARTETIVARVGKLPPVTVNSVFLGKTPYYAAISWGGEGMTVVDTRDFQTVKFVRTGKGPNAALYGPDGLIWVTHHNEQYIALLDPHSFEMIRKIDVGAGTHLVTFSPNGRLAIATHPMARSISFIDVETYEVVDQVYMGAGPDAPALKVDIPLRTLRTWQARAEQARADLSKAVVLTYPEPRSEREKVFLGACSTCHDMGRVAILDRLFLNPDRSVRAQQWVSIVRRMALHGAPLMPEQEKLVVEYLADREYAGFVERVRTKLQEETAPKNTTGP